MLISNISFIGWLHSIACLIALFAGAYVLAARKGTRRHRMMGWWYAGSMAVLNLSVMVVYRFDILPGAHVKTGPGLFGIFHVMALATLAAVALAIFSASRQRRPLWAHTHAQAMLFSYYMLVGGLINEAFVRVTALHGYALALSPHATNIAFTTLVRETQTACVTLWLFLAVWFAIKVARRHKRPVAMTIGFPMRYSGGVFLACVGIGLIVGAILGGKFLTIGFLMGVVVGFIGLVRARRAVLPRWGSPSATHIRVLLFAIALEFGIFFWLGFSGAFMHMSYPARWETSLAIVGFHFLIMRWSHGPMMMGLGIAVLAWLGFGIAVHLPLTLLAIGDGMLKLGFGAVMVFPLLKSLVYQMPRQIDDPALEAQ